MAMLGAGVADNRVGNLVLVLSLELTATTRTGLAKRHDAIFPDLASAPSRELKVIASRLLGARAGTGQVGASGPGLLSNFSQTVRGGVRAFAARSCLPLRAGRCSHPRR